MRVGLKTNFTLKSDPSVPAAFPTIVLQGYLLNLSTRNYTVSRIQHTLSLSMN